MFNETIFETFVNNHWMILGISFVALVIVATMLFFLLRKHVSQCETAPAPDQDTNAQGRRHWANGRAL